MKLINNIKQHRARLNMTQQQLANRVGVARQTILFLEKGEYVPSALLALKIAKVFKMEFDQLFELGEDQDEE